MGGVQAAGLVRARFRRQAKLGYAPQQMRFPLKLVYFPHSNSGCDCYSPAKLNSPAIQVAQKPQRPTTIEAHWHRHAERLLREPTKSYFHKPILRNPCAPPMHGTRTNGCKPFLPLPPAEGCAQSQCFSPHASVVCRVATPLATKHHRPALRSQLRQPTFQPCLINP